MSHNPPASYPENPWTQMIEETRRLNEAGGMRSTGPVSAGPEPTVRSAAMGQPVVELPPLSPEERAELDAHARELGLIPGEAEEQGSKYATLEEAIEAGRSVHPPAPVGQPTDPTDRMTAREFLARQENLPIRARVVETTRLPNFSKVQGIDLVRSVALVDGLEFALDQDTIVSLRTLVLGIAREQVMAQFDQALMEGQDGDAEV